MTFSVASFRKLKKSYRVHSSDAILWLSVSKSVLTQKNEQLPICARLTISTNKTIENPQIRAIFETLLTQTLISSTPV